MTVMPRTIKFNNGHINITPLFEAYHEFSELDIYKKEVQQYFKIIANNNPEKLINWFCNLMISSDITLLEGGRYSGKTVFCNVIRNVYGDKNVIMFSNINVINELYTSDSICKIDQKIVIINDFDSSRSQSREDILKLKEIFPNKSVILVSDKILNTCIGVDIDLNIFKFNQIFNNNNIHTDIYIEQKMCHWKNSFMHLIARNISLN